jgi:hypothetical protein
MNEKRCSQCEKLKPVTEFYMGSEGFKYRPMCKVCDIASSSETKIKVRYPERNGDPKTNAFNWREFIQPVPMKHSLWENPHKPDTSGKKSFEI